LYDKQIESVELWNNGRSTESYRGQHRILGETITLVHQHLYTRKIMEEKNNQVRLSDDDYVFLLNNYAKHKKISFYRGDDLEYFLLIVRDGKRVFQLPFVDGDKYHSRNSYYPIPYCRNVINCIPDSTLSTLIPKIILGSNEELRPLVFFTSFSLNENEDGGLQITYRTCPLDKIVSSEVISDERAAVRTDYFFEPGNISRLDNIVFSEGFLIKEVETIFPCSSEVEKVNGRTVHFYGTDTKAIEFFGYDKIELLDGCGLGFSVGPVLSLLRASISLSRVIFELKVGWKISYYA
jgi:hypothetical protein